MKKELAYKSIFEMISATIIFVLALVVAFSIFAYYQFNYTQINDIIKMLLFVFLIIALFSILQVIVILSYPKTMVKYDEHSLYFYKAKQKEFNIQFDDIQNLYIKTSIWTKPFVVYTAIVIVTQQQTYYLRHISKMKEVKDLIAHLVFKEDMV